MGGEIEGREVVESACEEKREDESRGGARRGREGEGSFTVEQLVEVIGVGVGHDGALLVRGSGSQARRGDAIFMSSFCENHLGRGGWVGGDSSISTYLERARANLALQ
ncbi:uncharacterized protein A4U43_C08F2000 [Asparagus officinalis]|nr:uncharacterized protein A4U43_C08F2000 [Asparagus officinalis]